MNYNKFIEQYSLKELEKDLNVEIRNADDEDVKANGEHSVINCSWIYGSTDIVLGIYEDSELKLISLFHELGHTMVSDSDFPNYDERGILNIFEDDECCGFGTTGVFKLLVERQAWILGLKYAEDKYGITFSMEAIQWAKKQCATYMSLTKNCGR